MNSVASRSAYLECQEGWRQQQEAGWEWVRDLPTGHRCMLNDESDFRQRLSIVWSEWRIEIALPRSAFFKSLCEWKNKALYIDQEKTIAAL